MSRFAIPGKHPELSVAVGWDEPLQTFCGMMPRKKADPSRGLSP